MSQEKTTRILRLYLAALTAAFFAAAVAAPDRADMLSGLGTILMSPAQVTKDYFIVGSISGSFLNMALVGALCTALTCIPGTVVTGMTVTAFVLTMGFTTWGINILNVWPFILGVFLNAKLRRQPLGSSVNLAMFATGLCPIVSEMLFRYPGDTVHGFTALGVVLGLLVGGAVGFLTPALAGHSPNLHKGFNLYSAAMPAGFLGFFIVASMYKSAGFTVPAIEATLGESQPLVAWGFWGVAYAASIAAGWFLNGRSFQGYLDLLRDTGHKADYAVKYSPALAIMNFGVYGLFIMGYYTLIGASFNGVTCGLLFCMSCFAFAGSHPLNVWPIMAGYVLAAIPGVNAVNSQAIVVGLCYASGLCPISGVYGWAYGILAGAAHYALVTSVPALHGGFCLYNGGFTAVLIAMMLVPQLEMFCRTKAERLGVKKG